MVQAGQFKPAVGEVPFVTVITQLKMISQQITFSSQVRQLFLKLHTDTYICQTPASVRVLCVLSNPHRNSLD